MDTKFNKYARPIIFILLVALLAAILVWFVLDINSLNRQGIFNSSRLHRRRNVNTNPAIAPSQIQGWMTFRYINYIFNLPPNYLNSKLGITDSSNANITLDKYSSTHKLDNAYFTGLVRQATAAYSSGGGK
jgi:hypothetical protein